MKKLILLSLLLLTNMLAISQATKPARGQRIIERKWKFIQHNIPLTLAESKKLEKAFFDFEIRKMQLNKSLKKDVIAKVVRGRANELSDQELNAIIDKKVAIDKELYALEKNYLRTLRKTLPPLKVIQYYKAEKIFKRELIKRLRKHKR